MAEAMSEQQRPKFGEPFPTLPMDDFHAINAATIDCASTTNEDLMQLIQLRPTWETLAPSSVTPHLLRRILSDDTAIAVLTDTVAELRTELADANGRADTAEQERDRYADAYHRLDSEQASAGSYAERAEKAEAARDEALARLAELGEPEVEYRFVLSDGRESEFDLHNSPCDCRRESRLACAGPWLAADALSGWNVGDGVAK